LHVQGNSKIVLAKLTVKACDSSMDTFVLDAAIELSGGASFPSRLGVSVGSYAGWIEMGRRAAAAMALHLISQPSFGMLTCRTPRKTLGKHPISSQ